MTVCLHACDFVNGIFIMTSHCSNLNFEIVLLESLWNCKVMDQFVYRNGGKKEKDASLPTWFNY